MLLDAAFAYFPSGNSLYVAIPNRNLTYLANVRSWVGSSTDTDNALLNRLIAAASQQILQYLQRPYLGLTTATEMISGRGERKLQLRNWPVVGVNSLSIYGNTVPPSTSATSYGFALEQVYGGIAGRPQNLGITGAWGSGLDLGGGAVLLGNGSAGFAGAYAGVGAKPFPSGVNNIAVNYSYGYCVQNEAQTIAGTPYQIIPYASYGSWSGDNGVSYASGVEMTAVTVNPGAGQYVPPTLTGDSPTPYYQFAAADNGRAVVLNYNYIPAPIEQACIETVGERYRYKSRIGQKSQSLGGQETTSYDLSGLTNAIKQMLDPFRLSWGG